MFGGIGSRTRRGCGSLELVKGTLPELHSVKAGPNMLTTLPGHYFQGKVQSDPLRAWAEAVCCVQGFQAAAQCREWKSSWAITLA